MSSWTDDMVQKALTGQEAKWEMLFARQREDYAEAIRQRDEARLDERRAIVAWLRRRAQNAIAMPLMPRDGNVTAVYVASIEGEAARIERGEHIVATKEA